MPRRMGRQPVAFAAHVISNIVLVPSTYDATVNGSLSDFRADSATVSGVAAVFIGLFLPLPITIGSKPSVVTKSYSSARQPGSSPEDTVYSTPALSASRLRIRPTVTSASMLTMTTSLPCSMQAKAVSAPIAGEGVTSATMSTASSWAARR